MEANRLFTAPIWGFGGLRADFVKLISRFFK